MRHNEQTTARPFKDIEKPLKINYEKTNEFTRSRLLIQAIIAKKDKIQ